MKNIMDAPFLKEMMRTVCDEGGAIFFSTHVLEVAEKLCDEIILIKKGNIKFNGTLGQLQSQYPADMSLEEIFLELTGTAAGKAPEQEGEED